MLWTPLPSGDRRFQRPARRDPRRLSLDCRKAARKPFLNGLLVLVGERYRERRSQERDRLSVLPQLLAAGGGTDPVDHRFLLAPRGVQQGCRLLFTVRRAAELGFRLFLPTVVAQRLGV